jgi:hypothetical protein
MEINIAILDAIIQKNEKERKKMVLATKNN